MDFEFNVPLAFGDAPACIVYMPEGEHFINASIGGRQKVIVDRSCLEGLQRDLALKLTQNVRPVCYFDHKTGPASFIPAAFDYMDGVGVILKGEWTESGKKAVLGRDYSYFSPAFKLNMATCRPVGLEPDDIEVGSLVNDPAFENIARIAASKAKLENFTVLGPDATLNSGGEDTGAVHNQTNNTNTTMYELLVKCGVLTKEEAASDNAGKIAEDKINNLKKKSEGCEKSEKELEAAKKKAEEAEKEAASCKAAKAKLKAAEEELAEVKASKAALIDAEIEAAIKAGKIAPENEEAKEALKTALTANIKAGKALIDTMKPDPAFATVVANKGKGGNDGDKLTGRDRLAHAIEEEGK
ncbi:phage protease [Akkermansia sp. Marseille-P9185]|uniref:phage protease n=1 Tax=Akkermansia massiliensis TaxID=2927224 RepID=UPI00209BC4A9|nr:phage protease [Akkermansia massiliensis]MCO8186545.1 phage protease [Akkermansia massiliensis]